MTPQTARRIANCSSELLDQMRDLAGDRVREYARRVGRVGNMTEAEVTARIDRELDRLLIAAQTVALDQLATELSEIGGDR
jgi:hypothetical protein